MSEIAKCELCGEPMPPGEQMFKFHGYSGECPKPPLPRPEKPAAGLWRNDPATPEGKYLVKRRDGTLVDWPCFVIGAKDPCAPHALREYANEAERQGMNLQYVHDIRVLADQFVIYRAEHGDGDPDRGRHRVDDPATIKEMRGGGSA